MYERAVDGQTAATHLAERLVDAGMPFRQAHHEVGAIAKEALDAGLPLHEVARTRLAGQPDHVLAALDPAEVAQHAAHGGGPARESVLAAVTEAETAFARIRADVEERRWRWSQAEVGLDDAVRSLITTRSTS
jgi:argininosuccinate lyase